MNQLRPAQLTIIAAGLVLLIASFLSFTTFRLGFLGYGLEDAFGGELDQQCEQLEEMTSVERREIMERDPEAAEGLPVIETWCQALDGGLNAWHSGGPFPQTLWPILAGLTAATTTALAAFGTVTLPARVLTFRWSQLMYALSLSGAIVMGGILTGYIATSGRGIGFWLMFGASMALLAATAAEARREESAPTGYGSDASSPTSF